MKHDDVRHLMDDAKAVIDDVVDDGLDVEAAKTLLPKLVQALDEGFADWQERFKRSFGYTNGDLESLGKLLRDEHCKTFDGEYRRPDEWEHLKPRLQQAYIQQAAAVAMAVRLGSTKAEDLGNPDVVAQRLRVERDRYRDEVGVERDRAAYWKAKEKVTDAECALAMWADESPARFQKLKTELNEAERDMDSILNGLKIRGIDP